MRDENQSKVSYPGTVVGSFQRGCKLFYCGFLSTYDYCQSVSQHHMYSTEVHQVGEKQDLFFFQGEGKLITEVFQFFAPV